jgi:hypothetical protein
MGMATGEEFRSGNELHLSSLELQQVVFSRGVKFQPEPPLN